MLPPAFAAAGMTLAQIGTLAAIDPALSDRVGRKWQIVGGMWVQLVGIAVTALGTQFMAISDVAHLAWRASAVGVYRLWRDLGYAVGALLAGVSADRFGLAAAVWPVAALTLLSGEIAVLRMSETLARPRR